jgi:hypothetical protein
LTFFGSVVPGWVVIENDVESIEIAGIDLMTRQNPRSECALQRCEAKDGTTIVAENELHHPIAQTANAVVKDNGRCHVSIVQRDSRLRWCSASVSAVGATCCER